MSNGIASVKQCAAHKHVYGVDAILGLEDAPNRFRMPTVRTDWVAVYRLIGERIRDERRRQGLTQEELAHRVGLQRASITNVEQGRQKLLVHTLIDIANSLNISPWRFLGVFDENCAPNIPDDLSAGVRNWIVHSLGDIGLDVDEK